MSLKELNINNIKVEQTNGINHFITVYDDNNKLLAKANCIKDYLKDFSSNWFYSSLMKAELDFFYYTLFNDYEKELLKDASLDEFIMYINDNYDDAEILNNLYNIRKNLDEILDNNLDIQNKEFIFVDSINAIEGYGAGTLIINYLKDNYDLIFLYSLEESEEYWTNKVNFKELFNSYMYWTNHKKLDDILSSIN